MIMTQSKVHTTEKRHIYALWFECDVCARKFGSDIPCIRMIPIVSKEKRSYKTIMGNYNEGLLNEIVTRDRCIQTVVGRAQWRIIDPKDIPEKLTSCENYKPLSINKEIPINRFSDLELVTDYD